MKVDLTQREVEALINAASFCLAGEWPDSGDDRKDEREREALERASEKLKTRREETTR